MHDRGDPFAVIGQHTQYSHQLQLTRNIKERGWFIEQNIVCILRERHCNIGFLPHAARK